MNLSLSIKNATAGLGKQDLDQLMKEARESLGVLNAHAGAGSEFTGWLTLATDPKTDEIARIKAAAAKIRSDSDALLVIGIGGSYLGARAAMEYIVSPNHARTRKGSPEIIFAGNGLSADATNEIIEFLRGRDFSINVISKSGTTTEPAIAFRLFRSLLEEKYGADEAAKRIYATTDSSRGVLKTLADKKGYETFVVPDDVGGRYSVLTPVGLLPLAAAGIDIDELIAGAADAMTFCSDPENADNPALTYAAVRNGLYREGKLIEIFAAFEPALLFTGEWWKQLYGESEGKDGKGLYPASVNFTSDLHSMGQYIQDGQRILCETFVSVARAKTTLTVTNDPENADGLNFLTGKDLSEINRSAMEATAAAHMDGGVPNMTVNVPDFSARSFGELVSFFELACGVSGYMLGVNPFNQPGVEAYKKNMFALIGKPGYEDLRAELVSRIYGNPV